MSDETTNSAGNAAGDGAVPAAPGSVLGSLRERRERVLATLHTDLIVPRWPGPIYVRYAPVPSRRIDAANKQAATSKDKDARAVANATLLAESCIGIFEVIDGVEVSIDENDRDGAWPVFDHTLAALLGVPAGKPVDRVRALYATDGDIISTADKLVDWSGYADDQMERDTEGN